MEQQKMERGLKPRHVEMIALGGTIGVGLFMGSANTIQMAGPSVLLCYAVTGVVMFFIMRIMGEMLYQNRLQAPLPPMGISISVLSSATLLLAPIGSCGSLSVCRKSLPLVSMFTIGSLYCRNGYQPWLVWPSSLRLIWRPLNITANLNSGSP